MCVCDAAPWAFYLPVWLMPYTVELLRTEPNKFISFVTSNGDGTGYPIGQIGFSGH
jgi:hypothetical protein